MKKSFKIRKAIRVDLKRFVRRAIVGKNVVQGNGMAIDVYQGVWGGSAAGYVTGIVAAGHFLSRFIVGCRTHEQVEM